jgi:uncharacterized protein YggU (UPF0235/DUF167 family)
MTVWVRPGAAHPGVGGEHGGALVVRVSARATGGQATAAALAAVAAAFGVPRSAVTLVADATSRTKILDVAGADRAVMEQLLSL